MNNEVQTKTIIYLHLFQLEYSNKSQQDLNCLIEND